MKVIVIGASSSGLFSAYLLAKKGVEVEVYDRSDVIGWPPRTLIVTNRLNEVLDFPPDEAIINKVRFFEIFSRSRYTKIELNCPDIVIEREKFIRLLARLAEYSGAVIKLGYHFDGFYRFGKKILVILRNLESDEVFKISTDILIGADGALSTVAQAASLNGHYLTVLRQAKVVLPKGVDSNTCQIWFDSNKTKYFYWLIPESQDTAAIGLIAEDDRQARIGLETFLKERKIEPLEFQEATVPLHRFGYIIGTQILDRNVFFVGDAAAQVKVTTVGGVVAGLSGAKALTNALLNGRNYRRELQGLKYELDLHLLIRSVLNRFKNGDYDQLIDMIEGRLKWVLEEWSRDELKSSFLNLILAEPRLILLGVKAFLRSIWG